MSLAPTSDLAAHVHWAGGISHKSAYPPLAGRVDADVAIVGAGFLGLSAALHLANAGRKVVVLEAEEPGAGASGRNAAQVLPGWAARLPASVARPWGKAAGAAMNRMAATAARDLFRFIDDARISCDARQTGHLSVVGSEKALAKGRAVTAAWATEGVACRMLSAGEVRALLPLSDAVGGWMFEDGGTLNPLALARGLAALAAAKGARICANSRATSLSPAPDGWAFATETGSLHVGQALIAVNAYGEGLWPGLNKAGYAVPCAMLASEPLADAAAFPWRGPWTYADDKTVFGGVLDPANVMLTSVLPGAGDGSAAQLARVANRKFQRHFPALEKLIWARAWMGKFLLTPDGVPKINELGPGLFAGYGCNGLGIAISHALGKSIAERLLSTGAREDLYPLTPLKAAPFAGVMPWLIQNALIPIARLRGG